MFLESSGKSIAMYKSIAHKLTAHHIVLLSTDYLIGVIFFTYSIFRVSRISLYTPSYL